MLPLTPLTTPLSQKIMSRRRHTILLFLLLLLLLSLLIATHLSHSTNHASTILSPANSTLGFGTILAVSHAHSPRRASLLWAANLTDLEIVIPPQQFWTEAEIAHLRGKDSEGGEVDGELSRGSALAWLGHLDALRWYVVQSHEDIRDMLRKDGMVWMTDVL
jgi:hypothetical protein